MARVVIVGAGVTGVEVAKRLDDPVVIESDVAKANMLKRELGDIRVVVGDATDERTLLQAGISEARSLLVAIGNDRDAYQTVLNSKPYKNLQNIIAVLQKPDEVPRFQRLGVQSIIIPDLATAAEVLSILKPSEKRISEIVITKGAAAIGQRLDDLHLPWGTSVIGVMRGDKLMAPTGDMALETMDVVHVSADVEELNAVRGVFLGDHRQLLPFSKILVPIMDESWFETEFQEALSLAMFCQAGIIGMFPAEAPWLVKKAGENCMSMQVPFFSLPGYNLDFQSLDDATRAAAQVDIDVLREEGELDIVEVLKKEKTGTTHLHEHGEEEDVDLVVLRADTLSLMGRVANKPICDPEHEAAGQMLRHIKRTGEMYGLEVVEDEVEGNPTLEFVSLVKSGDHDLTLVNRACKTVKKDIIRRVYMSAPKSVMII